MPTKIRRLPTVRAVSLLSLGWVFSPVCVGQALPFLPTGDVGVRHELELQSDAGQIALTTTWPMPTIDLSAEQKKTLRSVMQPSDAFDAGWFLNGAVGRQGLRDYGMTPRDVFEAGVQSGWAASDYAGGVLRFSYTGHPRDEMHYRVDDSYASWRFGNWWVTVGAQERWWGPAWDTSLILSNNARPRPGVTIERASSARPESPWLSWIGPWRLVTFMERLEGRRVDFPHMRLWGLRVTLKPVSSLEIGLSRTAQWCLPELCTPKSFWRLISGHSNAGENVYANEKPGQQQSGFDVRWRLPTGHEAVYWQLNGETIDNGTKRPRQTTNVLGIETAHALGNGGSWRAFLEYADTTCGHLSFGGGSGDGTLGCAYEDELITGGYRFRGRVIGSSFDRDARMWSLGAIISDSSSRTWDFRVRSGRLNVGSTYTPSYVDSQIVPVETRHLGFDARMTGPLQGLRYTIGLGVDHDTPEGDGAHLVGRGYVGVSKNW